MGLAGCSPTLVPVREEPQKCTFQVVTLGVVTSPTINPAEDGSPRPVVVRIYQLKDDVRLQNAKFEQIWKDDRTTLGEDLVSVDEVSVYPDSFSEVKFERNEAAQSVVGVALFRSPKGKTWFQAFDLPPPPGKGACGAPAGGASGAAGADCPDGNCGANSLTPRFALWIDTDRVDSGDDHLLEMQERGVRSRQITLRARPVSSAAPAAPARSAP